MIGQEIPTAEAKQQPQKRKKGETDSLPPADDDAPAKEKEKDDWKGNDANTWVIAKGDNKDWVVAKKEDWYKKKADKGYGRGTDWVPQAMSWCRECGKKTYVARSSPLRKQGLRHCQNHQCTRWQHLKPNDDRAAVISTGNRTPSIHSIHDDDDEKPDDLTGSLEDHDSNAYWDSFLPDEESDKEEKPPDEDETPKRLRLRKKSPDDRKPHQKGPKLFNCIMFFSLRHTMLESILKSI